MSHFSFMSWRRPAVLITAVIAAVAIAACGSSSKSSGSSSTSGGSSGTSSSASSPGLAQAKALLAPDLKDPTSVGITKPIGKSIPTGKKIVIVSCGQEGCVDAINAFKSAATLLGWSVTVLTPAQPTPQLIQADFTQAVNLHPDAVVDTALPLVTFQRQANELKAKGIPLISLYGPDPTGGPITIQIFGTDGNSEDAKAAAVKTVLDIGDKGTVGTVILSGYTVIADFVGVYSAEVKKLCPDCNIKSITILPSSIGSTDGTSIVNFVRANPSMSALLLGYDGVGGDLLTAAKSAGLTLPKTYSIATTIPGLALTKAGERTATVPTDYDENGWLLADALARIFTGQTASALAVDRTYPHPVVWSAAYHNIPASAANVFPPTVATYQAQFKKLWGKG